MDESDLERAREGGLVFLTGGWWEGRGAKCMETRTCKEFSDQSC